MQWLMAAGFGLLALAALRLRLRWRTPPTTWLLATFGTLGAAVVVSRLLPPEASGTAAGLARTAVQVAVVAFPYLLARFAASFTPVGRRARALGAALTVVAVAGVFALADAGDGTGQGLSVAYLLYVVAYWTLLSSWAAARLWRAGSGRPRVARTRMRLLAIASLLLNLALAIAVGAAAAGPSQALTVAVDLVAITSVVLFYLAFAPPAPLRREWRRAEEERLRATETALMQATTPEETAATLAGAVARRLGGAAALFDSDGRPIAGWGMPPGELERVAGVLRAATDLVEGSAQHRHGTILLRLRSGWLAARGDAYTPLFDAEELALLERLGVFADLALQRAALLQAERAARADTERGAAELEALLYGISHDLRNPLVSILGYVELLRNDYAGRLDDDGTRYLERLDANTRYMDALISDLLELSRIGRTADTSEPVPLEPLLRDIAAEATARRPQASVEVGTLPVVRMGQVRARQLFTNLVTNALAHGGRPDVRVVVTAAADGDGVTVSVADDGQGIPPAYRRKVFGIFERLGSGSAAGDGTGIGLAICKRVVEQIGGSIWIADGSAGTDVRVRFPQAVLSEPLTEVGG